MPAVWMLTGGIGSGKSTIRQELESMGVKTIDADRIAHEVYSPGGSAFDQVAARWPETVRDGSIDRKVLGDIVFNDPSQLEELEEIVHPAVMLVILDRLVEAEDDLLVVEISVPRDLLGVGREATVIADLPDDQRLARLIGRGMDPADISRRMARQPTRQEWIDLGDHTISTDGTREEVRERVRDWLENVRAR